jgi:hypothetical protein
MFSCKRKYLYFGRIKFIFLTFLVLFCVQRTSIAQNTSKSSLIFETKGYYGFVMRHNPKMRHLQQAHLGGFEINVGKQTTGSRPWQQYHNYPVMGIMFLRTGLGNPEVLGTANGLYTYLNFHLNSSLKTEFNFRFAAGIGYLSKCFDRIENYKNIAIGSHFNASVNMMYELKFEIFKHFMASASLGLTHFSNGATKTPNLGLNIPNVNVGVSYKLSEDQLRQKTIFDSLPLRKELFTVFSFGSKQIYPAYGERYAAYSLSAGYMIPLSVKRKLTFGLDFFLDYSNLRSLKRINEAPGNDYKIIKDGIFIGQEMNFSKLVFLMHLGYYYHTLYKGDGYVYTRVGLRYCLTKHLLANLTLKTHYAKADFLEWGLGYKIGL